MMRDESDPVLMLVAGLRAPRPATAREERVRQRCHAVMERGIRPPRSAAKPFGQRATDAALLAIVGSYVAVALIQATQVAASVLGLH